MGETSLVFRLVQGVALLWCLWITCDHIEKDLQRWWSSFTENNFCKHVSNFASLLGFASDHRVVMILQVPREALEFAGMSINFRSGKFGYSICPIFSKRHAEIFREF